MADTEVLAEDELIRTYLAPLAAGFPGAFGLEDDCAVLTPEPGRDLVVTTDAIAEGVHYLAADPPEDVGWKALAVNVSDLAGKAARPVAYLMALAFPQAPSGDWMAGFAGGLREAQQAFGCHLIGGDTDRRPGPPSITITAMGYVPAGCMLRRGSARAGDRLFVSGTIGDARLGLALATGSWPGSGLSTAERSALIRRYRRPAPRLALAAALLQHGHAAMDVSDGLVLDLGRMCRAGGVGAVLRLATVPLSVVVARVLAAGGIALEDLATGGDDYEILAAVAPEQAAQFAASAAAAGVGVTDVGEVVEAAAGLTVLGPDGRPVSLPRPGYTHF